jgi:hypothetical protein
MIRGLAASVSGVKSPFGAAHRVYFDTPPLKGLRMEPFRFHLETCRDNGTSMKNADCPVPAGTGS